MLDVSGHRLFWPLSACAVVLALLIGTFSFGWAYASYGDKPSRVTIRNFDTKTREVELHVPASLLPSFQHFCLKDKSGKSLKIIRIAEERGDAVITVINIAPVWDPASLQSMLNGIRVSQGGFITKWITSARTTLG